MFSRLLIIFCGFLVSFFIGFGVYHFKFFPYNFLKNSFKSSFSLFSHEASKQKKSTYGINKLNKHAEWASKVVKGGYILHMRHAMREKWTDVTAYDVIELLGNNDARDMSYYRAVCLTEKGIEDAKLVNKVFELAKIKISYVLSSPSCRSRETAIYAFNRIDQIEPSVLHRTAQKPEEHIQMGKKFRNVLDKIEITSQKNVIISGHGGTLSVDYNNNVGIIDVNEVDNLDDRYETGFVVIERIGEKYIARHKFNSIHEFVNNFFTMPSEDTSDGKFLYDGGFYEPKNINSGFIYNPKDTG